MGLPGSGQSLKFQGSYHRAPQVLNKPSIDPSLNQSNFPSQGQYLMPLKATSVSILSVSLKKCHNNAAEQIALTFEIFKKDFLSGNC